MNSKRWDAKARELGLDVREDGVVRDKGAAGDLAAGLFVAVSVVGAGILLALVVHALFL